MRTFSVTPARANLVSDLYIQNIKAFKPTPLSQSEIESSVHKFTPPAPAQVPQDDISTQDLTLYEAAPVETQEVDSTGAAAPQAEDWFVFENDEEAH